MRKLAICILLIAVLALTYRLWLPLPGTFLLVKDNIRKSDCIVPLNGDTYFRTKTAAELFKQGYSKNIVMSVLPKPVVEPREYYIFLLKIRALETSDEPNKRTILMAFRHFGIDPADIHFTGTDVTSTFEEAVATKKFMTEKGYKSLILVTSAFHMRRALTLFKWVFRNSRISIYNCSVGNEAFDLPHWWRRERDVRILITEYISFAHNIVYHFILHKGRTAFDTCY